MATFSCSLSRWELLLAGVNSNKGDLSEIEGLATLLEAHVADLRAEQARRAALQAEVRQSTRNLKASQYQAKELSARIGNYLRCRYGSGSRKLAEFGLKPRRKHRVQKSERNSPETNRTVR